MQTEDLKANPRREGQVQAWLFLGAVIRKRTAISQLLACKEELDGRFESTLSWILAITFGGIYGQHLWSDGLAGQGLHQDLHFIC